MSKKNETIYALSSPAGKSAIAVIRVSGIRCLKILDKITTIKKITHKKANIVKIKFKKKLIDQVVLTYFRAPKSFTGQDMIEINCHGGLAIIKKYQKP